MLFKPEYFKSCPVIEIHDKSFTTSQLFTQVKGFPGVSEYKLIEQNNNGNLLVRLKKIPAPFSTAQLNNYLSYMYSKSYLTWKSS